MSKAILIMGASGSGKTSSLASLPPEATYFIDCDGKGLPWRGWRKDYNAANKNYSREVDAQMISAILENVNTKAPHIKYVVIDTLNAVMVADEMRRSKEKGYDKWRDLAFSIWEILNTVNNYREDLTVILTAHSETVTDDGYRFTRMKTSGQKLQKIDPASYFNTVLLATVDNGEHYFITNNTDGTNSAKSPRGAFDSTLIPNDIMPVIEALEEF